MNDEIERINQHYRYVELLASVLDAFTTKHEQVLVVHTIFFSLNHWPDEELFEEIPQFAGFGIEYNEETMELRIDAPSLTDLVEICMLPCFPADAKPIMRRDNTLRTKVIKSRDKC